MWSVATTASGRKQQRQHAAEVILAAEEDGEEENPLFGLVHLEPIDYPVDGQMTQAWQQVVMALAAKRR